MSSRRLALVAATLVACAGPDSPPPAAALPVAPVRSVPQPSVSAPRQSPPTAGGGLASWYARGRTTASGERFDPNGLTAAHRTLAFGTRLRVCHDGRCVEVRVNDRGPSRRTGRALDLSRASFAAIAPLSAGVVTVTWEAA